MKSLLRRFFVMLVCAGTFSTAIAQQSVSFKDNWMRPDGDVNAMVQSGDKLYLGGSFSKVGYGRPFGAGFNSTTGAVDLAYQCADGPVYAATSDGTGGWYIGGYFTHVAGIERNHAAHIKADGTLDPIWNPAPNAIVYAIGISGTTVYIGGGFTEVDGDVRNNLAAVDATTGAIVTTWDPNVNGVVYTLTVSGSTIYIGGDFTTVGATTRNRLAAVTTSSAAATSWNPNANDLITEIVVSGTTIYVSGWFTSLGGQTRNRIAAVNNTTGAPTTWNPNADNIVEAIIVSGSTVYAGGSFNNIGGQARTNLAALDATTGNATTWNPAPDDDVYALALSGTTLYVGGNFANIGGAARAYAGAVNTSTGNATTWNPSLSSFVTHMAISGSVMYIGGWYRFANAVDRSNLAAINTTTGLVSPWNPAANSSVASLATAGSTVYAGGYFTSVGGLTRNRIAAIDTTGAGSVSSWNPNANDLVQTLAVSGSNVYAGGRFTTIGGQSRSHIAAISTSTGTATTWNPGADGDVNTLLVSGTTTIYAGGAFNTLGGASRSKIGSVPTSSNTATTFNPGANAVVNTLALSGSTLFVGGNFTTLAGQSRNHIGGVFTSNGTATTWNPNIDASVRTVAVNGNIVYAGGNFTLAGALPRSNLAAINSSTGSVTPWNPAPSNGVYAVMASGTTVYAGGGYPSMGDDFGRSYFTAMIDSTLVAPSLPTITNISANAFCQGDAIAITFSASGYGAGNVFTAQLSSTTGTFSSPTNLGTLNGANGGTINAVLSASQTAGTGYRIRIVASSPVAAGADNGTNIQIFAKPSAATVVMSPVGTQTICQGSDVTLSVPTGLFYQWYLNNNPIPNATNNSHNATSAGTYYVAAINASGCSRVSANRVVNVTPLPTAQILPGSGPLNVCAGQSVTLTAATASGNSYQWQLNGSNISGATASSYNATVAGDYTVVVTKSACSATSGIVTLTANCGPQITDTGTISICTGADITVNISYPPNTVADYFSLQISDSTGDFTNPTSFAYADIGFPPSITGTIPGYFPDATGFKIRVVGQGSNVIGNPSQLTLNLLPGLVFSPWELCAVTVDSATQRNKIVWNKDYLPPSIDSFIIYRNTNDYGFYERVRAQPASAFSSWIDTASRPAKKANRYYITMKNLCGESQPEYDVHRTIHLAINKGTNNNTWNLIWNGYEGMYHTRYSIWRGTNAANLVMIDQIEANEYNSYTDNTSPTGTIFYAVRMGGGYTNTCNPTAKTTGNDADWISSNIATNEEFALADSWMDMNIYPNPSSSYGEVVVASSIPSESYTIRILDVAGRLVATKETISNKSIRIGENFAPGVYMIEALGKDGKKVVRKWIRE